MKFYKRQSLNSHSPQDNTFAVEQDGRAIIDTTQSLRLPRGIINQRPTDTVPGQIRQNTELSEIETLVNYNSKLKTESGVTSSVYGPGTSKALTEISKRLIKISERVRSLGE